MEVEKTAQPPSATSETVAGCPTTWAPERWVDDHGDYLFGYAMVRLRDSAAAQDAVQETLLAALRGQESFRGASAERGWLLGILKHKIHDRFRKAARETSFTQLNLQHDEDTGQFVSNGLHEGAWIAELAPTEWLHHPGDSLDRQAFWQVFHDCAGKLPRQTARAFLLRELDEVESKQICTTLGITEGNLWVLLHRARLGLRRCLEANWFSKMNG